MKTIKIFLASSGLLIEDRKLFEIHVYRKTKLWVEEGIFLRLEIWEDSISAMSPTRSQDEYNKLIRECDIFVVLVHTKVGNFTHEEFIAAQGQFQSTRKPFIFTYFKTVVSGQDAQSDEDKQSVTAFKEHLSDLGHFYTRIADFDALWMHFAHQLDLLKANGFIQVDREQAKSSPSQNITHSGSGDIVMGNKIGRQINMGDGSTYNETNNG